MNYIRIIKKNNIYEYYNFFKFNFFTLYIFYQN